MRTKLLRSVCSLGWLSAILTTAVWANDTESLSSRVRGAVQRVTPLLAQSAATYEQQRKCFSCHHQALPAMTLARAEQRGFAVVDRVVAHESIFTHRFFRDRCAQLIQGEGVPGGPYTAAYALLGMSAQAWPGDDTVAALVEYLRVKQNSDGSWPLTSRRPPLEYTEFTSTALAIGALRQLAPHLNSLPTASLAQAREWLANHSAQDTEARAMRLLGLYWSHADQTQLASAAAELLAGQRSDGGWAQTSDMASDAYATGESLEALVESGQLSIESEPYRRGVAYLLSTQESDGSWHVVSRSKPFQAYFESGFPHGKDQFISIAATCWATLALLHALPPSDDPLATSRVPVFVAGSEGYHTFRIPALTTTTRGTLLAFAEGRKASRSDTGAIATVLRRSTDSGRTWQPLIVVADVGEHTIGNPCPVVDRTTGRIFLLLTRNHGQDKQSEITQGTSREPRTVWLTQSDDDGHSWSALRDISSTTRAADWSWYGTGPGTAVQLASGRLVVPCYHSPARSNMEWSHVIYSDDHGVTWQRGESCGPNCGESALAEAHDGTLVMMMRQHPIRTGERHLATSRDGGLTWSEPRKTLIDPGCQGSMLRVPSPMGSTLPWLAFCNPANAQGRSQLTIRLSPDLGVHWPRELLIDAGPSAYSCLALLSDNTLGCLYERGVKSPYETISFVRVGEVPSR